MSMRNIKKNINNNWCTYLVLGIIGVLLVSSINGINPFAMNTVTTTTTTTTGTQTNTTPTTQVKYRLQIIFEWKYLDGADFDFYVYDMDINNPFIEEFISKNDDGSLMTFTYEFYQGQVIRIATEFMSATDGDYEQPVWPTIATVNDAGRVTIDFLPLSGGVVQSAGYIDYSFVRVP
ncbi:MAG: hypothetical protein FK734_09245 [Asgard group archaeon]|nr:hypothetical protein [Asgard group archaeon]